MINKPFLFACLIASLSLVLMVGLVSVTSCSLQKTPIGSLKSTNDKLLPVSSLQKAYYASLTVAALKTVETKEKKIKLQFQHSGSAVVVSCKQNQPIVAVTCFHVIKGFLEKEKPPIIFLLNRSMKDQKPFAVRIAFAKPEWDLAILESLSPQKNTCTAAILATSEPLIGQTVYTIGSPMSKHGPAERSITQGVLSSRITADGLIYYRTDAAVFYGNSGGGLFNEKQELIGIIFRLQLFQIGLGATIVPGGNEAVALPLIYQTLKEYYRKKNETTSPRKTKITK